MKHFETLKILLTKQERTQFLFLVFLTILVGLFDTLGVASIMPFILLISNPSIVNEPGIMNKTYEFFSFNNLNHFLITLGLIVFFIVIISTITKFICAFYQIKFVQMKEYKLSTKILENYLKQPYAWFLNQNSGNLSKNILAEIEHVISGYMMSLLNLIASTIISLFIFTLLILTNVYVTISSILIIGAFYAIILLVIRPLALKTSHARSDTNNRRYILANEAFSNIKELKVNQLLNYYIERFSNPAYSYAKAKCLALSIPFLPRYIIECLAFGGILLVAIITFYNAKSSHIMPMLALYAFAGYRLMPALQNLYSNYSTVKFCQASLEIFLQQLVNLPKNVEKNIFSKEKMTFSKEIVLHNICFGYTPPKMNLTDIQINIKKNTVISIVGSTGSGKTTLLDILLGLLKPQTGNVIVDEKIIDHTVLTQWQNAIGYVPQNIFLSDDTIISNIALGQSQEDIDLSRIIHAAKLSEIHEFISNELDKGYQTIVGEKGMRLSGGQRQRIGIARALYNNPEILVIDEATSALDNVTEQKIIHNICKSLNKKTIIMVTHRLSTVKNCDKIFFLKNGSLYSQGSYMELIEKCEDFKKFATKEVKYEA